MMKQRKLKGYPHTLPTELTIHTAILSKLPGKSLLRCRCVSRLWCSIIDDSQFVSIHFQNFQNNRVRSSLLVLEPPEICDTKQICIIRNSENFRKMSTIKIDVTLFEHHRIVGYINGLFCMKRYVLGSQISKIFLWNPSIRKAMELPLIQMLDPNELRSDIDYTFGYDHVKNDYKVVASFYIGNELYNPTFIEIFSLITFSWKRVNISEGPCQWIKDGPKIFLNGVVYWRGIDALEVTPKGKFSHFVSFDVVNDSFNYIELPDCKHENVCAYERFPIILGELVALIANFQSYSQMWVMEELKGEVPLWSKRCRINLQLLYKCLCFKNDGEILYTGEKAGVNSFNIRNQKTKVLQRVTRFIRFSRVSTWRV
ncbi:hypothetical protein RDABS01_014699 [Bienertia sinuspersici]